MEHHSTALDPSRKNKQQAAPTPKKKAASKSREAKAKTTKGLVPPFTEKLGRRGVILLGNALVARDVVGLEPVDQLLVAPGAHHLDLLVRPRVHRDRADEAADKNKTNAAQDGAERFQVTHMAGQPRRRMRTRGRT